MPPPCPTITRTTDKMPHHPSDGSAPPAFFSLSCHDPTSCSHTEKKILHDHSTPCAPVEYALNAPPTGEDTGTPSALSCQGSTRPTPRPNRWECSSLSATEAASSPPSSKTPSRAAPKSPDYRQSSAGGGGFQGKFTDSEATGAGAGDLSVQCRGWPCRRGLSHRLG